MTLELSQAFFFEAAHTLARDYGSGTSHRVHGHTYHVEVTVSGERDARTGMVLDLAVLRAHIETVRKVLDHRLLDEVEDLGVPTLENLSMFIARRLRALEARVVAVKVWREASGDSCRFLLPEVL